MAAKPTGDFYELSCCLGAAIGVARLDDKDWVMSSGAQLSVLHTLASALGLRDAKAILAPLIEARTDEVGNCLPDHLTKH